MVIHARPLTIKGGNIEPKQSKNELTSNVMSGVRGERDLRKSKNL